MNHTTMTMTTTTDLVTQPTSLAEPIILIFVLLFTVFFPLCQGLSVILLNKLVTIYDAKPVDNQEKWSLDKEYDQLLELIKHIQVQH